jgi:hypothetical protein
VLLIDGGGGRPIPADRSKPHTLTVVGTSDQPGNADEGIIALTEPGIYYWLMTANASDGSGFNFGSIVNTNTDANGTDQAGVGGTHFPTVSLGHICTQTFIP